MSTLLSIKHTVSDSDLDDNMIPPPPYHFVGSSTIQHDKGLQDERRAGADNADKPRVSCSFWEFWKIGWRRSPRPKELSNSPIKYWKPVTLRAPVLGSFIAMSVFLIIVLELLSRNAGLSSNITGSGAVAYADDDGNLPTSISFAYLYFPTIVAVCYSMIWSWVDLDSKRLEPWFQLSEDGGASADDSLLLHYNFDFLAVVPISAARRRHWSVFFAGLTILIIFWAITPLQAAIFTTGTVIRTRASQMATVASLLPIESQSGSLKTSSLQPGFLVSAYGISWLDEKTPAYATKNYAVRPFAPVQSNRTVSPTEIWSTSVEAYSTDITCTPAKITPLGEQRYNFDNGKGCVAPNISPAFYGDDESHTYNLLYIGYYDNGHLDFSLESPNCTSEFSNSFLALWLNARSVDADGVHREMTALFCETSYAAQNITVQVNGFDHSIFSDNFGATESRAFPDNVFNISNFEYVIGSGFSPLIGNKDFYDTLFIEQYPLVEKYDIRPPITNMVGYAVAACQLSGSRFGDPAIIQSAFSKAHKLLFSVAISQAMDVSSPPAVQDLRDGQQEDQVNAILLVRVFSVIVETFLLLICFMAAALWYIMRYRKSQLVGDPNSISQYMAMAAGCSELKDVFRDMGRITKERLDARVRHNMFRLKSVIGNGSPRMLLEVLPNGRSVVSGKSALDQSPARRSECVVPPNRPWELRMFTASVFILVLVVSVLGLAYLNVSMVKSNGLGLPSSSPVVRQILENYLPTILATVLEPFWGVLNRLLCTLKPFDELRRGEASPSKSIDAKYTSLPPPLVFWRAVRSHHFLLGAVCTVSIMANILAVSLSGLFDEAPTATNSVVTSTYQLGTTFSGAGFNPWLGESGYSDHFYVTLANLSLGTTLSPWVGPDFFFVPFNVDNSTDSSAQFTAVTRGFGVETYCDVMTEGGTGDRFNFEIDDDTASAQLTAVSKCGTYDVQLSQNFSSSSATAFEVVTSGRINSANLTRRVDNNEQCNNSQNILIMGWSRLGPSNVQGGGNLTNSTTSNRSIETIFISCRPTFQTALFKVTVDTRGRIMSTQQQTPFDTNLQPFFPGNSSTTSQISSLLDKIHTQINKQPMDIDSHSTTMASGWLNYLLWEKTVSDDFTSPIAHVPSSAIVIPAVESLHRQLFATLLGLNPQLFDPIDPTDPNSNLTVTTTVPTTRIFMSQIMFIISIVILGLNLIVAVLYYTNRPQGFLPMMPTTIASIVGLVVGTRAAQDHSHRAKTTTASYVSSHSTSQDLEALRYGYGRFRGSDGISRIGIERHPWVVPLETKNPAAPARKRPWFPIGKRDEREPKSWI